MTDTFREWIVLEEEFVRRPDLRRFSGRLLLPRRRLRRGVSRSFHTRASPLRMTPGSFPIDARLKQLLAVPDTRTVRRGRRDYSNKMIKDHLHCVHHEDV